MNRLAISILSLCFVTACFSAPTPATEAELREQLKTCREANAAIVEAALKYKAEAETLRDLCR